MTMTILQ